MNQRHNKKDGARDTKSPILHDDSNYRDFFVKVTPKAQKSEIIGWEGDVLKVKLAAVPEKGRANKELIALLSKEFSVSKSEITILSGESSRLKRVRVTCKIALPGKNGDFEAYCE